MSINLFLFLTKCSSGVRMVYRHILENLNIYYTEVMIPQPNFQKSVALMVPEAYRAELDRQALNTNRRQVNIFVDSQAEIKYMLACSISFKNVRKSREVIYILSKHCKNSKNLFGSQPPVH